jgi:hypothetical protein
MYIIFISIFLIIFFFFILLVSLNYIVYNWEDSKIKMLVTHETNKKNESITQDSKKYFKDIATNTQNLINITTSKSVKVFGKLYNQAIVKMPNNIYNKPYKNKQYKEYMRSFILSTKKFFLYIISLTRPATIESDKFIEHSNDIIYDKKTGQTEYETTEIPDTKTVIKNENVSSKEEKNETQKNIKEVATIGMTSKLTDTNNDELSAFENLENRIVSKLKESGMSNYDIWLELGDLYLKYNENKKAMEVYALVLKHSKNEKHKELARNGLIGM